MRIRINSWRDTDHLKAGGSELVIDQYATGLSARGHDVCVRAGEGGKVDHPYRVENGGGTYSQYLLSPFHHLARGRDADVVLDNINGVGFYSPLYTNKPVVALIHHIHDEQWPMFYGPLVARGGSLQEHLLMPRAYRHSLIMTPSISIHDELVAMGFRADHLRHVPHRPELAVSGCETASQTVHRDQQPLFVAAGRLAAGKRIDLLLRLWEDVRPVTGGRLVIIGDGPDRAALEAAAGDGVEFVGFVSEAEKSKWFHRAWVLVHSAAREGWGLVISEAGLARTPSLGFNVPGVREAIVHEQTGRLATKEVDFVSQWIELAHDPILRQRLGAGAHDFATAMLNADHVGLVEEILHEAIDLNHQRRGQPTSMAFPRVARTQLPKEDEDTQADFAPVIDLRNPAPAEEPGATLSIVVPAYNEAQRLPVLLAALPDFVDVETTEVLVVDDGSTDGTSDVATAMLERFPLGKVLVQPKNQGKGAALRAGVAASRGPRVVFMDADMATDLRDLAPLLAALGDHAVAIGTRASRGSQVNDGSRHRRVMGATLNRIMRRFTNLDFTDTQCGFKAFRGAEAKILFHLSEESGFAQDIEILALATAMQMPVAEVPVRWTEIPGSKVNPAIDSIKTANELISRRRRGNHQSVLTGITLASPVDDLAVAAKEVARLVRSTDVTVAGPDAIHVLLPGAKWTAAPTIGVRLADAVSAEYSGRWSASARAVIDATDDLDLFETGRS